MTKLIDIQGKRFGHLVVVKFVESKVKLGAIWECLCDCGNIKQIAGVYLRNGDTISCGCIRLQQLLQQGKKNVIHGESWSGNKRSSREYNTWHSMKQRCYDPNNSNFKHYGSRGIKICEQWLNNFEQFLSDMGRCPSDTHSIDRIDNDKDYSPDNCRWATRIEQRNNQRPRGHYKPRKVKCLN